MPYAHVPLNEHKAMATFYCRGNLGTLHSITHLQLYSYGTGAEEF